MPDPELRAEADRCKQEAARPDATPARKRMFASYFRFYDAMSKSEPGPVQAQKNAPPRKAP